MQAQLMELIWIFLTLNVILTLASICLAFFKARTIAQYQDTSSEDFINLKIALINALTDGISKLFGFSILALAMWPLSKISFMEWPWSVTVFLVCLVLTDFLYYLSHLADHKIQFFWNQHCVHHSSKTFSLSTGYRKSWLTFFVDWIFYVPLALLGFPPEMIILCLATITIYTHLLHTNNLASIPYLEYILNTPKAHRIHHSAYTNHIDKNMAGVLMIWDQLFGTFTLESPEKVTYGLTSTSERNDIIYINFHEWMWIQVVYLRFGFRQALHVLMSSPEKNKSFKA